MAAKVKVFALRMSPRLYDEIQRLAIKDKSMNKIILDALDIYLGNMAIQQEAKEAVGELREDISGLYAEQSSDISLALLALEKMSSRLGENQIASIIARRLGSDK